MKKFIISLLMGASLLTAAAQEKIYQVDEVSVINYGDGRLLFRQLDKDKSPLQGSHRIIDGYHSSCILAEFKDGMYHGNYQLLSSNKLKEEGAYKEGRKDGLFKEYYSDGTTVKKETPYTGGKLNGIVRNFFTDGKTESEKGYAMSVEDGIERRYDYETGSMLTDRNYRQGRQDGRQITLMTSNIGQYVVTAHFEMGKPVGEFSEIFTDGSIKTQGTYNKEGRKDGEWLERDSFATKDRFSGQRTIYKDGEIVSKEEIRDFEKFQRKKK